MTTETDRPYRGRRMSWSEFWRQHPHLKPAANDNEPNEKEAKRADANN